MDDLLWSEYKTTFGEPTNCILNYIISKGYYLDIFNKEYFKYDQFKNHFSNDMEETYIGLKDNNKICYMSEIMFNKINLKLESAFTQSEFDNALSRFKTTGTNGRRVVMKRGIYLNNLQNLLVMVITNSEGGIYQYTFSPHKGYIHCKLELVKIKKYYNDEFISIEQKKEEPEKPVLTKFEELDELKSLIYSMFDELSDLKYHIVELKEHNKSLSERILSLENKPPVILY